MKKINYLFFILSFVGLSSLAAQDPATLAEINEDIYTPFTKAYQTLDYELFGSLHSEQLIRISGNQGKIKNHEEYIQSYKDWWTKPNIKRMEISFRFFERTCNESTASERGIYQLIYHKGTAEEKAYYGQFHVISVKEEGKWKITVDYDSNEGKTINKASYDAAYAIDDFEKYTKK